jgi:transaldolase
MRRAVFLDRDGVLNCALVRDGRPYPPATLDEFEILPGVAEALRALDDAGFLLIVATNQPDVARGLQRREVVEAMHRRLLDELPLDDITVCYETDESRSACYKPKPGMLLEAARKLGIDLASSYMVGDRWRDVGAGKAAGCFTIFIDRGYAEPLTDTPDAVCTNLPEAAAIILRRRRSLMTKLGDLTVKIFADGADLEGIRAMYRNPWIKGFTTNPTLMRKAGVADYKSFAREVLAAVPDRPVSFEVFADEFEEMERQALQIASWGRDVYVKIPVTNTKGQFSGPLIRGLTQAGVQVNVTAVFSPEQVRAITENLSAGTPSIISVFAGRIADTGVDPVPVMREALKIMRARPKAELIWASPRELLNIVQANDIGCHIITATNDILNKLSLLGKDHDRYSLETVEMFYKDALTAGYTIPDTRRVGVA